jgi:hypothetical protein
LRVEGEARVVAVAAAVDGDEGAVGDEGGGWWGGTGGDETLLEVKK